MEKFIRCYALYCVVLFVYWAMVITWIWKKKPSIGCRPRSGGNQCLQRYLEYLLKWCCLVFLSSTFPSMYYMLMSLYYWRLSCYLITYTRVEKPLPCAATKTGGITITHFDSYTYNSWRPWVSILSGPTTYCPGDLFIVPCWCILQLLIIYMWPLSSSTYSTHHFMTIGYQCIGCSLYRTFPRSKVRVKPAG